MGNIRWRKGQTNVACQFLLPIIISQQKILGDTMDGRNIERQIRSLLPTLIPKWSADSVKTARLVYDQFSHWQDLILDFELEESSSRSELDLMVLNYRKTWAEFENLVRLQLVRWKMEANQSDSQPEARSIRFNIAMWEESVNIGSPEHLILRLNERFGPNESKRVDK